MLFTIFLMLKLKSQGHVMAQGRQAQWMLVLQVLVEHEAAVSCVAVTESNRHVISGGQDKRLMVWGLSTGAVEQVLVGHTDVVTCVKVTSDGSTAISGTYVTAKG